MYLKNHWLLLLVKRGYHIWKINCNITISTYLLIALNIDEKVIFK